MILYNKIKAYVQQNELLWKSIFGLMTKRVNKRK